MGRAVEREMIVGVPKEIKESEFRVSMVPAGVEELRARGHTVLVEKGAGIGSGIGDGEFRDAGAQLVVKPEDIFRRADMIVKVKEPLPPEYKMMRDGQVMFTYLHLAASRQLTLGIVKTKSVCIAYETIQLRDGSLPLLIPMSEVAGRMAIQEGAKYLEIHQDGRGILLGGVPGVSPANVVILGGGIVGTNAAMMAAGLGARVTILDISLPRLRYLDEVMPKNVTTLMSNLVNIRQSLETADLLVGAVLLAGARAPVLVTRDMLKLMKKGAVIVDVAVDQGGCIETVRPTTHRKPTYVVEGVIHYCVANMPGAVARTSTFALTNATLPYVVALADKGWDRACREDHALARGLNVVRGKIVINEVADFFKLPYEPWDPEAPS
jgi:alanine dehydrogenase